MTGQECAEILASQAATQKFLQREDAQELIENGDFESLYYLAYAQEFPFVGQLHWLFEYAGINPFEYLNDWLPLDYFYQDPCIRKIKIPGKFKAIGKLCFAESALKSIEFEEGVENIASGALHRCSALTEVILPVSIRPLYSYSFKGCELLKEVKYRGDVNTARINVLSRSDVFADSSVTKVICADGELEIKNGKVYKIIRY